MGLLKSQSKEYSKAIVYFKKAISINPKIEDYHFNLGAAYERLKQYDETIEEMKKVLEINPNHSNAHNFIGYLYADLDIDLKEAEEHLNKATALEPENGYFLDSLGWIYYKKGMFRKALEEVQKAIKLIPEDPTIYLHLGEIYFSLKNYKEAEIALEKSFELNNKAEIPLEDSEKIQKKLFEVRKIINGATN
ncbi:MAG TPA: tetratricopeptide repeat protein, partial [Nitrospinota bacterium]|nr:tetratricopeptide repeat protein [Nitrospinota bacterium]